MVASGLKAGDYFRVLNGGYDAKIIEKNGELMIKALGHDRMWPLYSENPELFSVKLITDEDRLARLKEEEWVRENNRPANVTLKTWVYDELVRKRPHKIICTRCERYIGDADEESTRAVCMDCYGKKGEIR